MRLVLCDCTGTPALEMATQEEFKEHLTCHDWDISQCPQVHASAVQSQGHAETPPVQGTLLKTSQLLGVFWLFYGAFWQLAGLHSLHGCSEAPLTVHYKYSVAFGLLSPCLVRVLRGVARSMATQYTVASFDVIWNESRLCCQSDREL